MCHLRGNNESTREWCCTLTWDDSTGPVGGTRCRQCEWGAAGGGNKGRVYGHHVATRERHWSIRETHTLLHRTWTHHGQKQHGDFKGHLKQTGQGRRRGGGASVPICDITSNMSALRWETDPGDLSVMAGEGNINVTEQVIFPQTIIWNVPESGSDKPWPPTPVSGSKLQNVSWSCVWYTTLTGYVEIADGWLYHDPNIIKLLKTLKTFNFTTLS